MPEKSDVTYPGGRLRLYVEGNLAAGAEAGLSEAQVHYLRNVMRAGAGQNLRLFNGRDGEWRARITKLGKRDGMAVCEERIRAQECESDLWLLFAPVKRAPIDYLVEKATELGVASLRPVFTQRTIVARVNLERLRAHAIEAAEQSQRLSVPEIAEPEKLERALEQWDHARKLIFCDEGGHARPIAEALKNTGAEKWALLTGPEGGFTDDERNWLRGREFVVPVSLGKRILRADTAAIAALGAFQAIAGDWR